MTGKGQEGGLTGELRHSSLYPLSVCVPFGFHFVLVCFYGYTLGILPS